MRTYYLYQKIIDPGRMVLRTKAANPGDLTLVFIRGINTEEDLVEECLSLGIYPTTEEDIPKRLTSLLFEDELSTSTTLKIVLSYYNICQNTNSFISALLGTAEPNHQQLYNYFRDSKVAFCTALYYIYNVDQAIGLPIKIYELLCNVAGRGNGRSIQQWYTSGLDARHEGEIAEVAIEEPNHNLELEELRKKYTGTALRTLEKNPRWVYVHSFPSAKIAIVKTEEAGYQNNFSIGTTLLDFKPLQAGVYNLPHTTVNITKIPNRQWKRGVCESTYYMSTLYPYIYSIYERTYNRAPLDISILKTILPPPPRDVISMAYLLNSVERALGIPRTLDDIVENLKEGKRFSTAINNEFWISQSFIDKDLLLFYKSSPIGKIKDNLVLVENSEFQQEVYDLLHRANSFLEVV